MFLDDIFEKHQILNVSAAAFTDYYRELEGNQRVWRNQTVWEHRIYDEEMWNIQSALKGRLSSLQQYNCSRLRRSRNDSRGYCLS